MITTPNFSVVLWDWNGGLADSRRNFYGAARNADRDVRAVSRPLSEEDLSEVDYVVHDRSELWVLLLGDGPRSHGVTNSSGDSQ